VLLHPLFSHPRKCRTPSIACPPNTVFRPLKLDEHQEHEAREPIALWQDCARVVHAGNTGEVGELRQAESGD